MSAFDLLSSAFARLGIDGASVACAVHPAISALHICELCPELMCDECAAAHSAGRSHSAIPISTSAANIRRLLSSLLSASDSPGVINVVDQARRAFVVVTAEIEAVSRSAAAPRAAWSAVNVALDAVEVSPHPGPLEEIDLAESAKIAALEAELVNADAALEALQTLAELTRKLSEGTGSQRDAATASLRTHVAAAVASAGELLRRISGAPFEDTTLMLLPADPTQPLSPTNWIVATSCAPAALEASGVRSRIFLQPGEDYVLRVGPAAAPDALPVSYCGPLLEALEARLLRLTRAEAWLVLPSSESAAAGSASGPSVTVVDAVSASRRPLHTRCVPCNVAAGSIGIDVRILVPADAPLGSRVEVMRVWLAGGSVDIAAAGAPAPSVPLANIRVARAGGPSSPPYKYIGTATADYQTPSFSAEGTLFIPDAGNVHVFLHDGSQQFVTPGNWPDGGSINRLRASAVDDATGILYLGDGRGSEQSRLTALRLPLLSDFLASPCSPATPQPLQLLWATPIGSFVNCRGAAAVPDVGVVFASNYWDNVLCVHAAGDGGRLASVALTDTSYLAADPTSGIVFASCRGGIVPFEWVPASTGAGALKRHPNVDLSGTPQASNPDHCLAVVPPAFGKSTAYLVSASYSSSLAVFALSSTGAGEAYTPTATLIHVHELEGASVYGLAGDAAGTALAVIEGMSHETLVLPWPLPGMPALL